MNTKIIIYCNLVIILVFNLQVNAQWVVVEDNSPSTYESTSSQGNPTYQEKYTHIWNDNFHISAWADSLLNDYDPCGYYNSYTGFTYEKILENSSVSSHNDSISLYISTGSLEGELYFPTATSDLSYSLVSINASLEIKHKNGINIVDNDSKNIKKNAGIWLFGDQYGGDIYVNVNKSLSDDATPDWDNIYDGSDQILSYNTTNDIPFYMGSLNLSSSNIDRVERKIYISNIRAYAQSRGDAYSSAILSGYVSY